jgi:hypothetical protein
MLASRTQLPGGRRLSSSPLKVLKLGDTASRFHSKYFVLYEHSSKVRIKLHLCILLQITRHFVRLKSLVLGKQFPQFGTER